VIGGLSGLFNDAESGLFWAISDDRSEFLPGRDSLLVIETLCTLPDVATALARARPVLLPGAAPDSRG